MKDDFFFLDNFLAKYFLVQNNNSITKYHFNKDLLRLIFLTGNYERVSFLIENNGFKNRSACDYSGEMRYMRLLIKAAKIRLDRENE